MCYKVRMTDQTPDGFLFSYAVTETSDRGLAVFAEEPIPKGSLVWRHVQGQYAVYDEPLFRARLKRMSEDVVIS